jgi:hypothetical protein
LSVENALSAVRNAYTNLPKIETKAQKEAKLKARILAEAIKYGVTIPAAVAPEIEIKTVKINTPETETSEMPILTRKQAKEKELLAKLQEMKKERQMA